MKHIKMSDIAGRLTKRWRVFWLWRSGYGFWGRICSRLAGLGVGGYRGWRELAWITRKGYIAHNAEIDVDLRLGNHVFVGGRAVILRTTGEGFVELQDRVQIHLDCSLEILEGGSITVGRESALQRGCVVASAVEPIVIGCRAQIASYCTFYSYDHGIEGGREIYGQPMTSRGPIIIEDDVWLGTGVTVLSGVTIGKGAVVGAGSVVVGNIPENAIAVGVPARVVKYRGDSPAQSQ